MKPHYAKIRRVKTKSGATAIQVGRYQGKRFIVAKHIGSSKDTERIKELEQEAVIYVASTSPQASFDFTGSRTNFLLGGQIRIVRATLTRAYEYFDGFYTKIGFNELNNDLLKHLVFVRLLSPTSKIKSLGLIKKYFNVTYKKSSAFKKLADFPVYKTSVQERAIKYAKANLGTDLSLLFYDVTTLYFETFTADELRANGFSKDNKSNQPQILIGLVVNEIGFPVYYDIFKGNTFEGHTIFPVILSLKEKFSIKQFTVVADAAMLSEANLKALTQHGLNYVVGARVKTVGLKKATEIAVKLGKKDGAVMRLGGMIYAYSAKRATKDKADTGKMVKKAEAVLSNPSRYAKKTKFVKFSHKQKLELNTQLIEKHRVLAGIKGYRTNIEAGTDKLLVARYHDLWKVEQAFRISKFDLKARPIYHRKQDSIGAHILIVFMSLCLARMIEFKERKSLAQMVDLLKETWLLVLEDRITKNRSFTELDFDQLPH